MTVTRKHGREPEFATCDVKNLSLTHQITGLNIYSDDSFITKLEFFTDDNGVKKVITLGTSNGTIKSELIKFGD